LDFLFKLHPITGTGIEKVEFRFASLMKFSVHTPNPNPFSNIWFVQCEIQIVPLYRCYTKRCLRSHRRADL